MVLSSAEGPHVVESPDQWFIDSWDFSNGHHLILNPVKMDNIRVTVVNSFYPRRRHDRRGVQRRVARYEEPTREFSGTPAGQPQHLLSISPNVHGGPVTKKGGLMQV